MYGTQAQMVTETSPNTEYGGGMAIVSSCYQDPSSGITVSIQPKFSNHEIASGQVYGNKTDAAVTKATQLYWHGSGGDVHSKQAHTNHNFVLTADLGTALYEMEQFIMPLGGAKPATGSASTARSDGMLANVGFTFDSPVLFGDVCPTKIDVTIEANSHGNGYADVNDLFDVYLVLATHSDNTKLQVLDFAAPTDGDHTLDLEAQLGTAQRSSVLAHRKRPHDRGVPVHLPLHAQHARSEPGCEQLLSGRPHHGPVHALPQDRAQAAHAEHRFWLHQGHGDRDRQGQSRYDDHHPIIGDSESQQRHRCSQHVLRNQALGSRARPHSRHRRGALLHRCGQL